MQAKTGCIAQLPFLQQHGFLVYFGRKIGESENSTV